jgi:hypothetical protein
VSELKLWHLAAIILVFSGFTTGLSLMGQGLADQYGKNFTTFAYSDTSEVDEITDTIHEELNRTEQFEVGGIYGWIFYGFPPIIKAFLGIFNGLSAVNNFMNEFIPFIPSWFNTMIISLLLLVVGILVIKTIIGREDKL